MKEMEIKIVPKSTNKSKIRLTANSLYKFNLEITSYGNYLPITSKFGKDLKILIYPDIINYENNEITIINLNSVFIDINKDDVIGILKPLSQYETRNPEKKLSR